MDKHAGGRPPNFNNIEELQNCIDRYKEYLAETKAPPTMAGLACFTGIDRRTLYNYSKKDEYFPTIKKFVDEIMMSFEQIAIEKGNAGVIFLLKNYGYTDKQEIDMTSDIRVDTSTVDKLAELSGYSKKEM